MSKLTKSLEKHLTHEVKVVFTPGKIHYAKLCCVDCGNLFLNWLSPDQLVQIGQINETQKQELIKQKTITTSTSMGVVNQSNPHITTYLFVRL